MEKKTFTMGEVIFREGDESSEAYRLLRGAVEISIETVSGPKVLGRISEGEFFGEMSLIDDKPRSATATALAHCEAEVFHEENFSERVLGDPDNLQLYLRTLFDRLRSTDALLQWHLNRAGATGQPKASVEAALRNTGISPAAESLGAMITLEAPGRLHLKSATELESGVDLNVVKFPFRIGRATNGQGPSPLAPNDLSIPDHRPFHISRNHCIIERSGGSFLVRDFGSKLGTIVNGVPLGMAYDSFVAPLQPGENTLILGAQEGPHHFRILVK
ncbi:hypothetical protein AYO49_00120 [Verrucomicrobiaceae bacterium SCGC AG-212-N21]|nr:hypothetical protein AYO49_00120 [Verrucomicrobiaceae bacterium SCGC AG-212-N21]